MKTALIFKVCMLIVACGFIRLEGYLGSQKNGTGEKVSKDEAYGYHHEMNVRGTRYNFDADLSAGRQERPAESQAGSNQMSFEVLIDSLSLKGVLNQQYSEEGEDHSYPIEVA